MNRLIDNYSGGNPAQVPATIGMRVKVFNHVSNDFTGIIRAFNKRSARVQCDAKITPFTNHPDARAPYDDGWHKLVPYTFIRVAVLDD